MSVGGLHLAIKMPGRGFVKSTHFQINHGAHVSESRRESGRSLEPIRDTFSQSRKNVQSLLSQLTW